MIVRRLLSVAVERRRTSRSVTARTARLVFRQLKQLIQRAPSRRPLSRMHRMLPLKGLLVALLVVCGNPKPAARVSAEPLGSSQTLRLMTYNIHVGVGMDKKLDLPRIASVINQQHPDLVGLQEVDRGVERTQRKDEIAELAKLTKMEY